jgi:hypothetical protein
MKELANYSRLEKQVFHIPKLLSSSMLQHAMKIRMPGLEYLYYSLFAAFLGQKSYYYDPYAVSLLNLG